MVQISDATYGLTGEITGLSVVLYGLVVILQDAVRRAFEVVELTASERPPEDRADQENQHDT